MKKVMTIAGSDSGGGAGIQADLKAFAANGVHGTSAITAITAQNTVAVTDVLALPPSLVANQIDAIIDDIGADAVKTGMLANSAIIETVAERIKAHSLSPVVIDPVMVTSTGAPLFQDDSVGAIRRLLMPLATVVTPNTREAAVLTGEQIVTLEDMRRAARFLVESTGASAVLVKGGHFDGPADRCAVRRQRLLRLHRRAHRYHQQSRHRLHTGIQHRREPGERRRPGHSGRQCQGVCDERHASRHAHRRRARTPESFLHAWKRRLTGYAGCRNMQKGSFRATGKHFHPHPNLPPSRGKGLLHISSGWIGY